MNWIVFTTHRPSCQASSLPGKEREAPSTQACAGSRPSAPGFPGMGQARRAHPTVCCRHVSVCPHSHRCTHTFTRCLPTTLPLFMTGKYLNSKLPLILGWELFTGVCLCFPQPCVFASGPWVLPGKGRCCRCTWGRARKTVLSPWAGTAR